MICNEAQHVGLSSTTQPGPGQFQRVGHGIVVFYATAPLCVRQQGNKRSPLSKNVKYRFSGQTVRVAPCSYSSGVCTKIKRNSSTIPIHRPDQKEKRGQRRTASAGVHWRLQILPSRNLNETNQAQSIEKRDDQDGRRNTNHQTGANHHRRLNGAGDRDKCHPRGGAGQHIGQCQCHHRRQ